MTDEALDPRRALAIKRIQEKHSFWVHAFTYLVVNAMIVLVWLMTGVGFFWPIFIIGFWGMGVVIHGYNAYRGSVYTEEEVQRELERMPKDLRGL